MTSGSVAAPNFLLSYSIPQAKKAEFLEFVTEGKKKLDGSFEKDASGAEMTGVIAWLRSKGLHETKLYTVETADGGLMFISTANDILPDWATIPGFKAKFGPNTRLEIRNDLNALIADPYP